MRKLLFLLLLAAPLYGQTLVDFNACNGDGVQTVSGIDFSQSAWTCENAGLSGDATNTLSWYHQNMTSGKFRFVTPAVLVSVRASSSGGGSITFTTDQNETTTLIAQPGMMPAAKMTGFSKPATTVTVNFLGGWTLQIDDLTYTTGAVIIPPPPPPPSGPIVISCRAVATIVGTGFLNGDTAIIGTQPFTITSLNDTTITGAIPCPSPVAVSAPATVPPVQHSANLMWTASTSPVSSYKVFKSQDGVNFALLATVSSIAYTDTIQSGKTYSYFVVAVASSGAESDPSNTVSKTI